MTPCLIAKNISVRYFERDLLRDINFEIHPCTVTSLVGPSGVGKSTLLRTLNCLIEEESGFKRSGSIYFNGCDVDSHFSDRDRLRQEIGMVFQRPVIFPISIFKNVIFGVRHLGKAEKKEFPAVVEKYLREAFLWDEVKDRLHQSALELSIGQQQRLSIARTLALCPKVILMDEPTSALDQKATERIEELILSQKKDRAIVLVTHHVEQAERVSERVLALSLLDGAGALTS